MKCRADAGETSAASHGWRHQRREGVVHVRGPRQRAGAAGAHRPGPEQGRTRPVALHRAEGRVHAATSSSTRSPTGGVLTGKADPTPGYRGMHSFTLQLRQLLRAGARTWSARTAASARASTCRWAASPPGGCRPAAARCGVAQAALEKACEYVDDRRQFGKPIAEYQLTQYKLGLMATRIAAARAAHLRRGARDGRRRARRAGAGDGEAASPATSPSWVTQEAQLLHGGWGYAEEYPIARYVVDALVLPIFEGVKPTLELKVIARNLLAG